MAKNKSFGELKAEQLSITDNGLIDMNDNVITNILSMGASGDGVDPAISLVTSIDLGSHNVKNVNNVGTEELSITEFYNLATTSSEPSSPLEGDVYKTDGSWGGPANSYLEWDGSIWKIVAGPLESGSFCSGMTNYADGLSDKEIMRLELQSNEKLYVERIEFRQLGGGTSSNADVTVYAGGSIVTQTLGGTTKDAGETGTGQPVIVDISNATGAPIDACINFHYYIYEP